MLSRQFVTGWNDNAAVFDSIPAFGTTVMGASVRYIVVFLDNKHDYKSKRGQIDSNERTGIREAIDCSHAPPVLMMITRIRCRDHPNIMIDSIVKCVQIRIWKESESVNFEL